MGVVMSTMSFMMMMMVLIFRVISRPETGSIRVCIIVSVTSTRNAMIEATTSAAAATATIG